MRRLSRGAIRARGRTRHQKTKAPAASQNEQTPPPLRRRIARVRTRERAPTGHRASTTRGRRPDDCPRPPRRTRVLSPQPTEETSMADVNSPTAAAASGNSGAAAAARHKPRAITPGRPILAPSDQDTGATENALLLGIDLGTSRSSIVSMNGARKTVESYVGYAKDPVSRKYLKADVIYGKAALDNRPAVELYRPLEKGVIKYWGGKGDKEQEERKNLKAAQDLLQHLVDLAHPGRGDVLFGVVGVPSRASAENKQAMLESARNVLDSVMIVSEPFTVAYGMERM